MEMYRKLYIFNLVRLGKEKTLHHKLRIDMSLVLGATPINYTSVTDWQMETRQDNMISITLRQVY